MSAQPHCLVYVSNATLLKIVQLFFELSDDEFNACMDSIDIDFNQLAKVVDGLSLNQIICLEARLGKGMNFKDIAKLMHSDRTKKPISTSYANSIFRGMVNFIMWSPKRAKVIYRSVTGFWSLYRFRKDSVRSLY